MSKRLTFQGIMSEYIGDKENENSINLGIQSPVQATPKNRIYPELNGSFCGNPLNESSLYESPITSPGRLIHARPLQGRSGDTEVSF